MFDENGNIVEPATHRIYKLSISVHMTFGVDIQIYREMDFQGEIILYEWLVHSEKWNCLGKQETLNSLYIEHETVYTAENFFLEDLLENVLSDKESFIEDIKSWETQFSDLMNQLTNQLI